MTGDFIQQTFHFADDYDGKVISTLIYKECSNPSVRGVLYIHGYTDYFFQSHLAESFISNGYNFYALDLRKYGRSLLEGQHPNFCFSMQEYYHDIDRAIEFMVDHGNSDITLLGHSTGGLLSCLYAAKGRYSNLINRMVLNSPFFEFNVRGYQRYFEIPVASIVCRLLPFIHSKSNLPHHYGHSLHKEHQGEWRFDTRLKPLEGIPLYWSWLSAIRKAQHTLHKGLNLQIPILVMSSDRSYHGKKWSREVATSDSVLDVDDIKRYTPALGPRAQYITITDALHDIFLSRQEVRQMAEMEMFAWLDQNK